MAADITYILGEKGKDVLPNYYLPNNLIHAGHAKKMYLGNRSSKVCRFCRRDTSLTTFRKDAHLLPEFMGNKILFSYFECDECNARFSAYESAFTNYFNINHTLARVKGKKKIPEYNSKRENFKVVVDAEDIHMYSGIGNDSVTIDEQRQRIAIKTIRPSYVPCDVLKCLVKMGLGAVRESELHHFELTRKWLMGELDDSVQVTSPYSIIHYNIGGGLKANFPFVILYAKKAGVPVPHSAVIIAYDRFKFQLFMPLDIRDKSLMDNPKVLLPIQEHLVREREDGKGLAFFWKDMSGIEKVVGEEHSLSMGIIDGEFIK